MNWVKISLINKHVKKSNNCSRQQKQLLQPRAANKNQTLKYGFKKKGGKSPIIN